MANQSTKTPINFGLVLFPGFQALDAFGPLDCLNILSKQFQINLALIAETRDPVSTRLPRETENPMASNCAETVVPTHAFADAPSLDVLLIPGGVGTRVPSIQSTEEYIKTAVPQVQYVITVCTGSKVLAQTGHLDGRRATTNKSRFDATAATRPQVQWIRKARWIEDGNIWTSAGVSAGIDVTLAFIEKIYGKEAADSVTNTMEYDRHEDSSWDPFSELWAPKI